MSKKILTDLDLCGNRLLNANIPSSDSVAFITTEATYAEVEALVALNKMVVLVDSDVTTGKAFLFLTVPGCLNTPKSNFSFASWFGRNEVYRMLTPDNIWSDQVIRFQNWPTMFVNGMNFDMVYGYFTNNYNVMIEHTDESNGTYRLRAMYFYGDVNSGTGRIIFNCIIGGRAIGRIDLAQSSGWTNFTLTSMLIDGDQIQNQQIQTTLSGTPAINNSTFHTYGTLSNNVTIVLSRSSYLQDTKVKEWQFSFIGASGKTVTISPPSGYSIKWVTALPTSWQAGKHYYFTLREVYLNTIIGSWVMA